MDTATVAKRRITPSAELLAAAQAEQIAEWEADLAIEEHMLASITAFARELDAYSAGFDPCDPCRELLLDLDLVYSLARASRDRLRQLLGRERAVRRRVGRSSRTTGAARSAATSAARSSV